MSLPNSRDGGDRVVAIDVFLESLPAYPGYAITAVDVIRATTTAVTAVSVGCEVHPVPTLEAAVPLAARLGEPLLVGELGGNVPYGFDANNSPAEVAGWSGERRPVILLTTSGTRLICEGGAGSYVASLRNYSATSRHLAAYHRRVALIAAGTRGEFREEDELCCAWIAGQLIAQGFAPADERTDAIVQRWRDAPVESLSVSNSVEFLRRTGQLRDLEFVLSHVDDLDLVVQLRDGLLVAERAPERIAESAG